MNRRTTKVKMSINGLFSDSLKLKVKCTRKSRVRGKFSVPIPRRFVEPVQRTQTKLFRMIIKTNMEQWKSNLISRAPFSAFVHPAAYLIGVNQFGLNAACVSNRNISHSSDNSSLNDKNAKTAWKTKQKATHKVIRGWNKTLASNCFIRKTSLFFSFFHL